MKREIRSVRAAQMQVRKGDKPGIEGYAAVFNHRSEDLGWFREIVMPGAFARALREKQDVRALVNHDASQIIGRTKSGTLTLSEDQTGLHWNCDLPDTQAARDLMQSIERGDVDQCSFGFRVVAQKWAEEKDANGNMELIRELHDVDLFDVSAVTYPAYPQTSVSARSLWPDGMPDEVKSHAPKELLRDMGEGNADECECDCQACENGNCAMCTNEQCSDPECAEMNCPNQERALVTPEERERLLALVQSKAAED